MTNISVITADSMQIEATTPVIISASRSTDIPAFYAKWFFNRLAKGYCAWYNPFNQQKMYISFERCRVIVFWTKNPAPIIPYLPELDKRGIHCYFQVTLNDYVKERFEPNVPSVEDVTNPTLNSINEKCARIRKVFEGLLPKTIARYYSISGKRGEAKKIELVRANVVWKCKLSNIQGS